MFKLNNETSELCGIISGDGHLSRDLSNGRNTYRVEIVGNNKEDLDYLNTVREMFHSQFGKTPKIRFLKNYMSIYFYSKEILEFFENIGVIVGKKSSKIYIPEQIKTNKNLTFSFLRGLADTDFNISFKKGDRKNNSYPRIVIELASEIMIDDIKNVLDKLSITCYAKKKLKHTNFGKFTHYRIEINGRNNFDKWMNSIGFSNPKHTSKIEIWKRLGYCPPKTTYLERLELLKNSPLPDSNQQPIPGN